MEVISSSEQVVATQQQQQQQPEQEEGEGHQTISSLTPSTLSSSSLSPISEKEQQQQHQKEGEEGDDEAEYLSQDGDSSLDLLAISYLQQQQQEEEENNSGQKQQQQQPYHDKEQKNPSQYRRNKNDGSLRPRYRLKPDIFTISTISFVCYKHCVLGDDIYCSTTLLSKFNISHPQVGDRLEIKMRQDKNEKHTFPWKAVHIVDYHPLTPRNLRRHGHHDKKDRRLSLDLGVYQHDLQPSSPPSLARRDRHHSRTHQQDDSNHRHSPLHSSRPTKTSGQPTHDIDYKIIDIFTNKKIIADIELKDFKAIEARLENMRLIFQRRRQYIEDLQRSR